MLKIARDISMLGWRVVLPAQCRVSMLACRGRRLCTGPTEALTEGELNITRVLKSKFPTASDIKVQDISGGCGSMYEVYVETDDFKGKRIVMQHRMVNEALKEEIKEMHGLRISTSIPAT